MLAVPMILLYEFGILMSRYITPREKLTETP
jgi:Sec-independent protein secretion pathway component TatC